MRDVDQFVRFFNSDVTETEAKKHFSGKEKKIIKIKDKSNFFVFEYKSYSEFMPLNLNTINENLKTNKFYFLLYRKTTVLAYIFIFFKYEIKKETVKELLTYLNIIKINQKDTILFKNNVEIPFFNTKTKKEYFIFERKPYLYDDFFVLAQNMRIDSDYFHNLLENEKRKTLNFLEKCTLEKIITNYSKKIKITYNNYSFFLELNEFINQTNFKNQVFYHFEIFLKLVKKKIYESYIENRLQNITTTNKTYLEKKQIIKKIVLYYFKENLNKFSCGDNLLMRKKIIKGYPVIQYYKYKGKRTKCICFKFDLFLDFVQNKIIFFDLKKSDFYEEFNKNEACFVWMKIFINDTKIKLVKTCIVPFDIFENFI